MYWFGSLKDKTINYRSSNEYFWIIVLKIHTFRTHSLRLPLRLQLKWQIASGHQYKLSILTANKYNFHSLHFYQYVTLNPFFTNLHLYVSWSLSIMTNKEFPITASWIANKIEHNVPFISTHNVIINYKKAFLICQWNNASC